MSFVPYAVLLLREHEQGQTLAALAATTGIPIERIEQRLRAARRFLAGQAAERALSAGAPSTS